MKIGIYIIKNMVNGYTYVGGTTNLKTKKCISIALTGIGKTYKN